jgi:hypothetical protein
MVPLERAPERDFKREPGFVLPKLRDSGQASDEPRAPRRFRVLSVLTRAPLAEDVDARAAVDALKGVRSIVDVNVYVWQEERGRWRLLTFPEQRVMWELASE